MVIRYWSAFREYIVERDLSKDKITNWEITDELGYKEKGGSLIIDFNTSHLGNVLKQTGIHPPVSEIINYEEVIEYLNEQSKKRFEILLTNIKQIPNESRNRIGCSRKNRTN